jgi:hypothetical protein
MRDQIPDLPDTVDAATDTELDSLRDGYPWLDTLKPFYIDWELIWVM